MTTALIYDPIFLEHKTPPQHPERSQRAEAAWNMLRDLHWLERDGLVHLAPRAASTDELAAVHERAYIQEVAETCRKAAAQSTPETQKIFPLGTDTYVSGRSYEVAQYAAGAPLVAIDAVMQGEVDNAYCLVRPPGHHAVPEAAMGFCIFNNVAVAARYAIDHYGLERVMIIDYDVHHGNGTQEMFYEDPHVLYFSIHQAPFYPGTGLAEERGEGAGLGTTINVPVPAGTGFETYDPVFRQVMAPAADRFQPQLILVSAGYDVHWKDGETDTSLVAPGINLSIAGISKLNQIILDIARAQCDGRVIYVQEGGYDLQAMASGVATSVNQLLGDDAAVDSYGPAPETTYHINTDILISELRRIHQLTGYRMKNAPKPDRAKLLREIKGPAATDADSDKT